MSLKVSEKQQKESSNGGALSEASANGERTVTELEELRKILIQPEEVGEVLPAALKKKAKKDHQLAEATLPIVEENIRISAQRNPRVLAEAIFPIIGPAIRKAISEALAQMVQSLNQTLERSLSPQGLKWRIEAMKTGKPFAEVVILNSLLYRVEQVFLIHKKTGILLQHAALKTAESQDGEMVSAMLTAIQDFVHDSFQTSTDATLDSLKVKDFSIWIENSPDAILAAVIRGNAPLTLREVFLEAIEQIQYEQETDLKKFEGETAIFEDTKPVLQECLQMKLDEKAGAQKSSIFSPFNVLSAVLGVLILVGGFFFIRDYWRWSSYVERLRSEPGIIVTNAERGFLKHEIAGLRDNLAIDPTAILNEYGYDADDLRQNWKSFQDANPQFVLQRAAKILSPPPGVELSFADGVLTADGAASAEWFAEAKKLARALAGVETFRAGLNGLKSRIESQKMAFNCGTTDYAANEEKTISGLAAEFELLSDAARLEGKSLRAEIVGLADASGSDAANAQISQSRADKVLNELFVKSEKLKQDSQNFKALGVGAGGEASECAVRFRVFFN